MMTVPLREGSIHIAVEGRFGSAFRRAAPRGPRTVSSGALPFRAVCEAAGIHNILTKELRSTNPVNLVKANHGCFVAIAAYEDVETPARVSLMIRRRQSWHS